MPCLYITTNLNLDGIDTHPIFSEATTAVSSIIGKPQKFVMVILKSSVPISFEGNKEPAAYAEIVSMGGIDSEVKRKLIATIGTILQSNLSIPRTRFFLKVFDTTAFRTNSKI
ncbi:macrophage migration inhibitory factor homolog [Cajanus cajan]|uniref:Macrophage migration inhibitory factor isogeny n=1 Tax=Cajanus cajan TaxID=3821 RepID=A0A151T9D2_CAJCA|nr:macrophage migration inhibitory factor homolog [Cajanus cajan]KYP63614.1 Macrophage migration inhibitory factor isogeny [Cajanus cajan]